MGQRSWGSAPCKESGDKVSHIRPVLAGTGLMGPSDSPGKEDIVQGPEERPPLPGQPVMVCRDAQKLIAQNSPARGPGPRHREKVARVASELHALPRSPAGPRRPGTLHRPQPPGQRGPGSAQSAGESRSVWGCCRGWGASPLPSPPGGDPAGWGAQARRTGSSCGLWGPWREGQSMGLGARDSGSGEALPARLAGAVRGAAATAGCEWREGGGGGGRLCAHG